MKRKPKRIFIQDDNQEEDKVIGWFSLLVLGLVAVFLFLAGLAIAVAWSQAT